MSASLTANKAVTEKLRELCEQVENKFSADCLCYSGPISWGVDDAIRDAVEDIVRRRKAEKRDKLLFILETNGGCPSSNDLRPLGVLCNGVSGPSAG